MHDVKDMEKYGHTFVQPKKEKKPKKMLMKDYVGRKARIVRRTESKGGTIFDIGEVVEITNTYRGKFDIRREDFCDKCPCRGWKSMSHVPLRDFELLPEGSTENARAFIPITKLKESMEKIWMRGFPYSEPNEVLELVLKDLFPNG